MRVWVAVAQKPDGNAARVNDDGFLRRVVGAEAQGKQAGFREQSLAVGERHRPEIQGVVVRDRNHVEP